VSTEVDVAIVGGGPTGAAAAHYLASRGHSVLVCEKKEFPREKTCGDGLTPRAVKELTDLGLGEELSSWERVRGLRVQAAGQVLELEFPKLPRWPDYGLVKPRRDLDSVVLAHAEAAGAKVLFSTEATAPIFDKGVAVGIRAKRNGDTEDIRAKWVICSEGSGTRFSRALGRDRNAGYPMGLAIRQYFHSPMEHSGWFESFLNVRITKNALPGYGWVFPVGDGTVNAGVGLLSTFGSWRTVNLHDLQRAFVSVTPSEWQINEDTVASPPRGGRLFMGGSVWPPHGPGFLLAGDAAGMINPFNGEGIAYGYETGRIAGRHIDEALRTGGSPVLAGYTEELTETYGPYYRLGRRFVKVIGYPGLLDPLISLGMRWEPLMSFAFTLMANLEDRRVRNAEQRGMAFLKLLAEWKP
jgi:menaquinone-9 beta-reductase